MSSVRRIVMIGFAALACRTGLSDPPAGSFVDPRPVPGGVNVAGCTEFVPVISADGRTIYFAATSCRGGHGGEDIWFAERDTPEDPFGAARNLNELAAAGVQLNTAAYEQPGWISLDGLRLYFGSGRSGNHEIYQATRTSHDGRFDSVELVCGDAGLLTGMIENRPTLSADEKTLVFHRNSEANPNHELWIAERPDLDSCFEEPRPLAEINTEYTEAWPALSSDGLTLFFSEWVFVPPRPGTPGARANVFVAFRETTGDEFGAWQLIDDAFPGSSINTRSPSGAGATGISPDWPAAGSKLYFVSDINDPSGDLWEVTWVPSVPDELSFGPVERLPAPINDVGGSRNGWPGLSPDGLELYFSSDRPGSLGGVDIWLARRTAPCEPWGEPDNLGTLARVNSDLVEGHPSVGRDGLELFFHRTVEDLENATSTLWVARRDNPNEDWGEPEPLKELNSGVGDTEPAISPDGRELYFDSRRPGYPCAVNLFVARRPSEDMPFGEPVLAQECAGSPFVHPDGLHLFYVSSTDERSLGADDIFVKSREHAGGEYGPSTHLGDISSAGEDCCLTSSPDGRTLYFTSDRDNRFEIFRTEMRPSSAPPKRFLRGDCNNDGTVNISDPSYLLNWLFLGGPALPCEAAGDANGDGKVDIADASYLLNFLFLGGPAPVAPFPECGPLPEGEPLSCDMPPEAEACR